MINSDNKSKLRTWILVITYAVVLLVGVMNINKVWMFIEAALSALSPIIVGLGIAFVLNLLVKLLEGKVFFKMKDSKKPMIVKLIRPLCIALSYIVTLALITALIAFVGPQLMRSMETLRDSLPNYLTALENTATDLMEKFNVSDQIISTIQGYWENFLGKFSGFIIDSLAFVFNFTKGVATGTMNFILGVVISIYVLFEKEKLIRMLKRMLNAFSSKKRADRVIYVGKTATKIFNSFIAGQITEAAIIGVLCFLGMKIFGFEYALLISVIVGVTALIPIFGAFIGTIPSAFILFIINPMQALWFIIFIVVLQQLEGNLIYPKVVGTSIGLSGMWVIVAMLLGGYVGGFMGMVLGIPTFATIYVLVREATNRKLKEKNLIVQ